MKYNVEDENAPILKIDDMELFSKKIIGEGGEATVYKYIDAFGKVWALKIFERPTLLKIKKIALLSQFKDNSFVFPQGLVVNKETDSIMGYYMEKVNPGLYLKNLNDLIKYRDMVRKLEVIKEADEAIKRAHDRGIILGDIHGGNILIDKNNQPKFCDTDNYKVGDYDFDLVPDRADWLYRVYGGEYSDVDNDKFSFGVLALNILLEHVGLNFYLTKENIDESIELLIDAQTREGFRELLSDSHNKPYMSEFLDYKRLSLK